MRIKSIYILVPALLFSGCAYYNTFYNAKKFYNQASKERQKRARSQIVEASPEEKELMKKQGISTESEADRASGTEMQNYQKAIEKASSLLEFYPKSRWVDDALMLLGECFYYRREFSKAQRKFEELIQLYPNSEFVPEAKLLLAKNYIGLLEYDRAEAQFREMVVNKDLDKSIREEAEYELAGLYYEKRAYDMAADAYRIAAKEADDKLISAMSLYRLGECLIYLKQPQEAVAVFKRAVKASPNEDFKSQATYKLGEAQSLIGDYEGATRTFSNLLSKELELKRIPMIKLQLANNLQLKGEEEDALKWYENIIKDHGRTDASAKSYFALAEEKEYKEKDYVKAREFYDLVRSENANSIVAPRAKERSDHIKSFMDLTKEINEMLGIKTAADSTKGDEIKEEKRNERDDAPINLSSDGMWVNYSGRDRPPPKTLANLTEEDKLRAEAATAAVSDTLSAGAVPKEVKNDSLAQAQAEEKEKMEKGRKLAEKRLALGELLMFHFDMPDSAMSLFVRVCEQKIDSTMNARAFYSIGYILKFIKHDTVTADSVYRSILHLYPNSAHAEGARKQLGLTLMSEEVDSAAIAFRQAEKAALEEKNMDKAMELHDLLQKTWPTSPFAEKSLYAQAWLYENMLYQYDKALATYQDLTKKNSKSAIAQKVSAKITAYEKVLAELKEKAKQDSIKLAAGDTLKTKAAVDSLGRPLAATDSTAKAIASQTVNTDSTVKAPVANPPTTAVKDTSRLAVSPPLGANPRPPAEIDEETSEKEREAMARAASRLRKNKPDSMKTKTKLEEN